MPNFEFSPWTFSLCFDVFSPWVFLRMSNKACLLRIPQSWNWVLSTLNQSVWNVFMELCSQNQKLAILAGISYTIRLVSSCLHVIMAGKILTYIVSTDVTAWKPPGLSETASATSKESSTWPEQSLWGSSFQTRQVWRENQVQIPSPVIRKRQ